MTNPRLYLDIHVLQSVPPSNLNRDDTGSPKSAVYGGVRRARVSSQAWKRATRKHFELTLEQSDLGVRTKRLVELLSDEIIRQAPGLAARAGEIATEVLVAGGIKLTKPRNGEILESGYLLFLSNPQVSSLARAGIAAEADLAGLDKKAVRAIIKSENSIDLALFGRMVADVSDLNVDASAQVAHAISVHAVDNEFDFFTAVDDHKAADADEDAGAGMIGTVEFNSSTLYRYATVNISGLDNNLGDAGATKRAVATFINSFVRSMPTGKQNTFANGTLPDAVVIFVRDDQPISLVGAFEDAVKVEPGVALSTSAIRRLVGHAQDTEEAYGSTPLSTWTVGVGARAAQLDGLATRSSLDSAVNGAAEFIASRLVDEA